MSILKKLDELGILSTVDKNILTQVESYLLGIKDNAAALEISVDELQSKKDTLTTDVATLEEEKKNTAAQIATDKQNADDYCAKKIAEGNEYYAIEVQKIEAREAVIATQEAGIQESLKKADDIVNEANNLNQTCKQRSADLDVKAAALDAKEVTLNTREQSIETKEKYISSEEARLTERENNLNNREKALAEKENEYSDKLANFWISLEDISKRVQAVTEWEANLAQAEADFEAKTAWINDREKNVKEQEEIIANKLENLNLQQQALEEQKKEFEIEKATYRKKKKEVIIKETGWEK